MSLLYSPTIPFGTEKLMIKLKQKKITVFAPATVANVSCGFDILGFALSEPGDVIKLRLRSEPGVRIAAVHGGGGKLPTDPYKNTAGIPAIRFMEKYASNYGVDIELFKQLPLSSGMGSSAAAAAAVLYGLNYLFDQVAPESDLLKFALEAESVACGYAHGDNVVPALLGGFILIRSYEPLDIIRLPVPENLFCALIHPKVEVRTELARSILPKDIPLRSAVQQWGNIAGLIAGLYRSDYALIGRSMQDVIVEPYRTKLIPKFERIKQTAMDHGALGCGIAGSGPSIFALCRGQSVAEKVGQAMKEIYEKANIECDLYISGVNRQGPRILTE
jgi:homoserine kinase